MSDAALEPALEGADVVVFLCSGNMVRSAFAELYARHVSFPLPVRSGATTYRNDRIFPETARALIARGVDRDAVRAFRPTHVDELVPRLDRDGCRTPVFLCMREHHRDAMARWPAWSARSFLLDGEREIADPVLEGADFAATFARVAECVEALAARLARRPRDRRP